MSDSAACRSADASASAATCSTAAPLVAMEAHVKGGFTLAKLAEALRGMPRDARMLIRLPDGRLVEIDHATAAYVTGDNATLPGGASAHGTRYGIILVAADQGDAGKA